MLMDMTAKPPPALSERAAKLSFAAAALFLILLAALHFIKPDFDPSWRMISEYEIGRYGWLIQVKLAAAAKKLGRNRPGWSVHLRFRARPLMRGVGRL
jgi:hypothetical protein